MSGYAKKIDFLRLGVHLFGLSPLLRLFYLGLTDHLTVNPIQFIIQSLGRAALYMLIASLAVTPLVALTGWRALTKHRRTLGLYAFCYAALHFSMFVGVDYAFDLHEIARQITEKPYILVGTMAGLILLALAATSFKWAMKALGKRWKALHRGIYLAGILVITHYAWAVKGNLASLSGNILRPLAFGILLVILFILRVPWVRHRVTSFRRRFGLI